MSADLTELLETPGDPIICWSTGRSQTTATWVSVGPHSWLDFIKHLNPDRPTSAKEVRPYVGGTLSQGRRSARTVEQRHLLTLDADYADADFLLDVADILANPYLVHTTWRHTPEVPRYRLIMPLDRAVSPSEYKELAWAVMNRLGGDYFDKTTAQPERFMWGPSTQSPRDYLWGHYQPGLPYLPVNEWLAGRHSPSDGRGVGGPTTTAPTTPEAVRGAHSALPEATDEDMQRALEILYDACDAVEHVHERDEFGGRNEAVFNKLPLLFRFVLAGALDEQLVIDELWEAAQRVPADEPYERYEFEASVKSARQYARDEGPVLPDTTPTRMAVSDFEGVVTTLDDLWTASPQLKHIAQAADNLGRNRMAVLAATLSRVLVCADPSICLAGAQDGSVGGRASLNLGVALVGSTGQGKSTIYEQSAALFPKYIEGLQPSTGQGLIQSYLHEDDEGNNVLIDDPRLLFFFDEVDTMTASAADKSSTLMSEIRTMLTGGSTGTQNATQSRRRHLSSRSYNFQLILNVQPTRAGGLLDDRDAGTPQRFIWVTVTDPNTAVHPKDRPPWPGVLPWSDAFLLDFEFGLRDYVEIPQWLKDELLDYDYKVSLEGMEGGTLSHSSHRNLLRLKVATGIAFLHESPEVLTEHVGLADLIIEQSIEVQNRCQTIVQKTAFSERLNKARSENRVGDVLENERLNRLVSNVKKTLKEEVKNKDGGWVTWTRIRPAHRDREVWSDPLWEALEKDPEVETRMGQGKNKLGKEARLKK